MQITKIPGLVVESALSVAGVRVGTEEPHFIRQPLTGTVEIRQYGPRIAAETAVAEDEDRARSIGFRRLARYIFGANHRDETISMTAPVSQQPNRDGDEIAMTAPVAQSLNGNGQWTIRFFMPSKWSIETLPKPDDDNVRLVTVPAEPVAVLRFTGDRSPKAVASRAEELVRTLQDNDIVPVGQSTAWFYDPPWTLPFRRRNEIAIPVDTRSVSG